MRLIVLAGRPRKGAHPLAERFGVSHKCLIPLAGKPLVAHVLQTAANHPRIASLAVCIEREGFEPIYDVLTRLPGRGTVALVPARDSLADSVRAAAEGWEGPVIVTTADHALLSESSIDALLDTLETADIAFALTRREWVEAAHRAGHGHYLRLRDGEFAACDLYGMSGPAALRAIEVFRGDRSGQRIARATGVLGLLRVMLGMETLCGAIARASRRLALKVGAVILGDGSQAIDVDDDRTYAVVRDLLETRGEEQIEAAPRLAVA
ncbi:nucleotidyl transferase [Novosphingobium pentaromativorans US6-1]|nr:nucleotidyl transferase [Novosphingobium pentaromativorans US6-1]